MAKKICAVLMSVIMIFAAFSAVAGAAYQVSGNITDYPVVMVPGYSATELVMVDENGNETEIWGVSMDSILDRALNRIVDLGKGLALTVKGNPEYLGKTVGEEIEAELEYMKMNPDGTSKYDVRIANPEVQSTNMAYILENGLNKKYIHDIGFATELAKHIGEENIFCFTEDWRTSVYDCAVRLDAYIQAVKAYTGKDKVNIVAVSHGGQVSATYFSLFGYKGDVNNAVLNVPAIGGAALAYDIVSHNVRLDEETLVYFLEHGFDNEGHYAWLLEAQQLGVLDDIIAELYPYIDRIIGNFGSIWDFIPTEYYDELRDEMLDPVENAALIEKSDYVHHEIMTNYHENLQKCAEDYGININIIAGTGVPSVTGLQENSDAIICTVHSTGAVCAPYGKRYSDGFTGAKTQCSDPSHDHVSPSMEVDASTGFLPENTWYVDGLYHGMMYHDEYSRGLAIKLLLTDEIVNVYSDPEYPQFRESSNLNNAVYVTFADNQPGFISGNRKTLVVKNISEKYSLKVTSVEFMGAKLVAHTSGAKSIAPGEEIRFQVTGNLPEISNALMQVKVNYNLVNNTTAPIGEKLVNFKIVNGTPVVYDEQNPYTDADYTEGYESAVGEKADSILQNLGLSYFVSYVYQMIMSIIEQLGFGAFLK